MISFNKRKKISDENFSENNLNQSLNDPINENLIQDSNKSTPTVKQCVINILSEFGNLTSKEIADKMISKYGFDPNCVSKKGWKKNMANTLSLKTNPFERINDKYCYIAKKDVQKSYFSTEHRRFVTRINKTSILNEININEADADMKSLSGDDDEDDEDDEEEDNLEKLQEDGETVPKVKLSFRLNAINILTKYGPLTRDQISDKFISDLGFDLIESKAWEKNLSKALTKSSHPFIKINDKYQYDPNKKNDTFKCNFCFKNFASEDLAIFHIRNIHSVNFTYRCFLCGKIFNQRQSLLNHLLDKTIKEHN